jgi:hypothetical protein
MIMSRRAVRQEGWRHHAISRILPARLRARPLPRWLVVNASGCERPANCVGFVPDVRHFAFVPMVRMFRTLCLEKSTNNQKCIAIVLRPHQNHHSGKFLGQTTHDESGQGEGLTRRAGEVARRREPPMRDLSEFEGQLPIGACYREHIHHPQRRAAAAQEKRGRGSSHSGDCAALRSGVSRGSAPAVWGAGRGIRV